MKDPIHEAVCKAAGWEAYCSKCGSQMRRTVGLGMSYSLCQNSECIKKQEIERREWLKKANEYWKEGES